MNNEVIAEICHEVNRALEYASTGTLGPSWDQADPIIRQSAISGVQSVRDNPDLTAEEAHELWLHYKQMEGWVHGEVKCVKTKTHPCMLPYSELPAAERIKDSVFVALVDQLKDR